MRMHSVAMLCAGAAMLVGCGGTKPPSDSPRQPMVSQEAQDDVATCSVSFSLAQTTANTLALGLEAEKQTFSGRVSNRFESSVKNALLNDPGITDEIKRRFLDHYFSCINQRLTARLSEPSRRVVAMIGRSQRLWNRWAENVESSLRPEHLRRLPPGAALEYDTAGNELMAIADAGLEPRFRLMKYERAALMYMLATETLIRFGSGGPGAKNAQVEYAQKALDAALEARTSYAAIAKAPTSALASWLIDSEVHHKTLNRLADIRAQLVFLGLRQHGAALDADLDGFDCDYVRTYLMEEPVYKRIQPIKKFDTCRPRLPSSGRDVVSQASDRIPSERQRDKSEPRPRDPRERDSDRRDVIRDKDVIRPPIDVQIQRDPAESDPPKIRPPIDPNDGGMRGPGR